MLFRFVTHKLHWLSRVPGFPQYFDALLLAWTALLHRERLHAIEALEDAALRIDQVQTSLHRYGGTGFCCAGVEFAHVHGNGLLDVHTGRDTASTLIAQGLALPHHLFGDSAWVSFWLKSPADIPCALKLLHAGLELRKR